MKKILLYLLYKNMITSITYNPLICSFALRIKTEIPWHSLKEPHGLPLHTFSVLPQGRYITSCIPRSFPGPGFSSQRHQSCASFTITTSTTICSSTHLWDQKVKFASVERELLSFSFHTFLSVTSTLWDYHSRDWSSSSPCLCPHQSLCPNVLSALIQVSVTSSWKLSMNLFHPCPTFLPIWVYYLSSTLS